MKIVHIENVELVKSPQTRGGTGHSTRVIFDSDILQRDSARKDNFYLGVSYFEQGQLTAPRHRHNFEQWRYMFSGSAEFSEGELSSGMLGYFPDGAYYGPEENLHGTVAVLQFGSVSGQGYIDRKVAKAAFAEMKKLNEGAFEDGTYRRAPGVEGNAEQDGNEAIFEYVRKRPLTYAIPQYNNPILINIDAFPWMEVEGRSGILIRRLGMFSSSQVSTHVYKMGVGNEIELSGRGVYICLNGKGRIGNEDFPAMSFLYLESDESFEFEADMETELLFLGLPREEVLGIPADGCR